MKVASATPPTDRHAVFGLSTMRRPASSVGTRRAEPAVILPTTQMTNGPTRLSVAKPISRMTTTTVIPTAAEPNDRLVATIIATAASPVASRRTALRPGE